MQQNLSPLEKVLIPFAIFLILFHSYHHVEINGVVLPKITKKDLVYNKSRNTPPIVNEEYKVIFFQVAKAASSEWTRFFTRLAGSSAWCQGNVHNDSKTGLRRLSSYTLEEAQRMMTDPEWTRAIFVRNPKTRLLSAFLDKAVAHSESFVSTTCVVYQKLGGDLDDCVENHKHFDFFLKNITTINHDNVHWRSIYSRVDEKWWPYINYIANMENLSNDAQHFLQSIHSSKDGVSAWDRIGKTGWSDNERDCNTMGDKAFLAEKDIKHQTNAGDKMRKYYTPELEKFVEKQYQQDYNNPYFQFSPLKLYPENK